MCLFRFTILMDIIEVCEGKIHTGAHPTRSFRKSRLFAIMDKYYFCDGLPTQWQRAKRLYSKSPQRALTLVQQTGKICSGPNKPENVLLESSDVKPQRPQKAENVLLESSAVRPQHPHKAEDILLHSSVVKAQQIKNRKVSFREDREEENQKLDLQKFDGASQKSSNNGKFVARFPKVVPFAVFEVNLAAVAIEMRVKVRAADMPPVQQERAFRCGRKSFDGLEKVGFRQVALTLKKEFDKCYGPAWHCIVGRSFGSFVTHSSGGFLYFSMDKVSVLLFKTAVEPIDEESLRE